MLGTIINVILIIIGGTIGTLFGNKINEKYTKNIMTAIGLIVCCIGIQSVIGTSNILIVLLCLLVGTLIGTAFGIDEWLNTLGDKLKAKLSKTGMVDERFSDAFVTCSVLFAVGTMAVIGSIQAGLNKNYEILITKSIIDFVSSVAFAAALGPGVIFACIPVFVLQGGITLLAGVVEPFLTAEVVAEMSAVGGPIFIGMAVNIIGLRDERVRVGDMLPGIFLPILYFPLAELFSNFV